MRTKLSKILVTGGAGFIASAFVRLALKCGYRVSVIDKMTYAADLARLKEVCGSYKFFKVDICDKKKMGIIFNSQRPDAVVHFAAESHVDRSIRSCEAFIEANIKGTQVLLDASRKFGLARFVHISTDEVYGDIIRGRFREDSNLLPNSPYAASKAAADLLIKSYIRTYAMPAIIVRPSNNYGPWQYPEKLIPLSILKILRKGKIPVYARGENVREWLYVDDCAEGVLEILKRGKIGAIYNLGSGQERKNIEVVRSILRIMGAPLNLIQFVRDRPGHDLRYSLNSDKVHREVGWRPRRKFEDGLRQTVKWYVSHKAWLLSKWQDIAEFYGF